MDSQVRQCRQCRKLFQSAHSVFCTECLEETEAAFEKIKNYLYENPAANVVEISQKTGVPEKVILDFLKEGRLTIDENNGLLLCEQCGRSISTGRLCAACSRRLEHELKSAYVPPSAKKVKERKGLGKMHVDYYDR